MSKVIKLSEYINSIEEKKTSISTKQADKKTAKLFKKAQKQQFDTPWKSNNDKHKKNKSKLGFSKKDNYTRCKNSAIYSLAMREHSRLELYNKLTKKDFSENVDLDKLLNELEDSNYLNEARFVESFIRYRSGRGQGFIKISNDLKQRGIDNTSISDAMQEAKIDWFELATAQREKKFGEQKPEDFKEKARQMRFLSGRGFGFEVIRAVVG